MKISRILLFIYCVLLGLTVICVLMPADGITVGNVTLEFPSFKDVLVDGRHQKAVEADTLTPEQQLQQRLAALQSEKVDGFRKFCKTDPTRIYMPKDDETYLDPLFDALLHANKNHVRILHLGDSQLECDRITGDLRELFQHEFGGSGIGMIPASQTIDQYSVKQKTTGSPVHYMLYGSPDFRASHHRYGIMAQVDRVADGTTVTCEPRSQKAYPHIAPVSLVKVMAKGSGSIYVTIDSGRVDLKAKTCNPDFTFYTAHLGQPQMKVSLTFCGSFDVYGIMLDCQTGVNIDNIPMRGCSGDLFTKIDRQSMQPYFDNENVRLIIMQYGGNAVPFTKGSKAISKYISSMRDQIHLLRSMSPKSRILFVGPGDMATTIKGTLQTYPCLPEIVDSLKTMSLQEGIAFWDMYQAMGGEGSMLKWNRTRPQLTGDDYVHFTPRGAKKISEIFYKTLQFYYRFYRVRTGKDQEAMKSEIDSLMRDSVQKGHRQNKKKQKGAEE